MFSQFLIIDYEHVILLVNMILILDLLILQPVNIIIISKITILHFIPYFQSVFLL